MPKLEKKRIKMSKLNKITAYRLALKIKKAIVPERNESYPT
jgi:hypothetical protein